MHAMGECLSSLDGLVGPAKISPELKNSVLYPAQTSVKHSKKQQTLDGRTIEVHELPLPRGPITIDNLTITRPGQGRKTRVSCGTVIGAIGCPNKDSRPFLLRENCHRITCPECYPYAINQQTRRAVRRLTGLDEAYRYEGVRTGDWKHIAVSDDPYSWTPAMIAADRGKKFKKKCRAALSSAAKDGWWGGIEIFHSHRKKHHDGTECHDKECKLPHVWEWGPHCHYLTKGYFDQGSEIYEETGLLVKRIPEAPGRDRDLYDTIHYQLSHSALFMETGPMVDHASHIEVQGTEEDRVQGLGYAYVGKYSNDKGAVKVKETFQATVPCEKCGAALHEYEHDRDGKAPDYEHDKGEHLVRVSTLEAYLLHRKERFVRSLDGNLITREVWYERGPVVVIPPDIDCRLIVGGGDGEP